MKLRYTPEALAELDRLIADIAVHSPQAARRVLARIETVVDLLVQHPHSGQLTSLMPMRRIVVARSASSEPQTRFLAAAEVQSPSPGFGEK